jgi:hypothetical protein
MAGFFAGVIAGVAAVGLLLIILTPSRRLRAEARIDQEIETRLLLGDDPDLDDDDGFATGEREDEPARRHDYGAAELQALRQIGVERSSGRKGGSRKR